MRQTEDLLALFGTFEFRGASELLRADDDGARVAGEGGADRLLGGDCADRLLGGGGRDTLVGGAGDDNLKGGGGRDFLEGGGGDDKLIAGGGNDRLSGGRGADTLRGGGGRDTLEGGADTFLFRSANFGDDRISADFNAGVDRVDLSGVEGVTGLGDLTIRTVGGNLQVTIEGVDASLLFLGGADLEAAAARIFLF